MRLAILTTIFLPIGLVIGFLFWNQPIQSLPNDAKFSQIKPYWTPTLKARFEQAGLQYGNPIYVRIFKTSNEMELWVQNGETYDLYQTYDICRYSGRLGPKLKEGDKQAPEGFYYVSRRLMHPNSSNHLAFNIGFPNRYDRSHDRTGSFLMVHGKCTSIGCFAMTDKGIEEIYTIADAALEKGQDYFRVHSFPFRMNDKNMRKYQSHKWIKFWENLKIGYDYFETHKIPPEIEVKDKTYVIKTPDLVS